jgi:hypothetical protein
MQEEFDCAVVRATAASLIAKAFDGDRAQIIQELECEMDAG